MLVGHYNRLLYKEEVDPRLLTRGFTKDQLAQMQASKGTSINEFISCNLHFKGNSTEWQYPHFDYVYTLFNRYQKHGLLPYPGSHADQPAKIIELFEIFENLDLERQQKVQQDQQREQAKKRN